MCVGDLRAPHGSRFPLPAFPPLLRQGGGALVTACADVAACGHSCTLAAHVTRVASGTLGAGARFR